MDWSLANLHFNVLGSGEANPCNFYRQFKWHMMLFTQGLNVCLKNIYKRRIRSKYVESWYVNVGQWSTEWRHGFDKHKIFAMIFSILLISPFYSFLGGLFLFETRRNLKNRDFWDVALIPQKHWLLDIAVWNCASQFDGYKIRLVLCRKHVGIILITILFLPSFIYSFNIPLIHNFMEIFAFWKSSKIKRTRPHTYIL